MKLNKLVLKFVSISFSILVMLLVVIGLIKLAVFAMISAIGCLPKDRWKKNLEPM